MHILILTLFAILITQAISKNLFANASALTRCLNIGSIRTIPPFEAEHRFAVYQSRRARRQTLLNFSVSHAEVPDVYHSRRAGSKIRFRVKVRRNFVYNVEYGFVESERRYCRRGFKRLFNLRVFDHVVRYINIFQRVGCHSVLRMSVQDVVPDARSAIETVVTARRGQAILSTMCLTRGRQITTPSPIISPSPSASASAEQPTPSPTPTASASPSASASASAEPSPPNTGLLRPSECESSDCVNMEGRGAAVVIGSSFSKRRPGRRCTLRQVATARLHLPAGVRVKFAMLYWSALAPLPEDGATTVSLNGVNVTSSRIHDLTAKRRVYYGAEADVTSLVRESGLYQVRGIYFEAGELCIFGNDYAAWGMVVVYEGVGLPMARLNLCTKGMVVYNSGSVVDGCIPRRTESTTVARTTVVAFDGEDSFKDGQFIINGREMGLDLFNGSTAHDLDIITFDVLPLLSDRTESLLKYELPHSNDVIIIPLRVTYTIL